MVVATPIEWLRAALVGRYEIERELGSGGMAAVYLARDVAYDRPVAIKVMRPELASALGADRFVREVRITANIRHSGIVPLLDSGVLRDGDRARTRRKRCAASHGATGEASPVAPRRAGARARGCAARYRRMATRQAVQRRRIARRGSRGSHALSPRHGGVRQSYRQWSRRSDNAIWCGRAAGLLLCGRVGGLAKAYVRAFQRAFVFPGYARDSALRLAVAAVDRALLLDSTDASVWVARGELSKQVDPTSVRTALRAGAQAVTLDSANGPAWHLLALSHAEGGDLQKAIAAWREGVRRSPAYTQGLAFLGLGHFWTGAYDSAMVWVDSAVAVNPNYLLGRTSTGEVAIELGDGEKAIAAYEVALRLSTDVEVVNGLSRLA